ncbi:MAG: tRNA (guanosine(46)-N7)-methyltransferase TrmB [Gammaproteobacteria bacterium]|nr:tRNA (guanosine(46)-N7)-methyltransferase TrmB [Gammaproteobacteria bacterium]
MPPSRIKEKPPAAEPAAERVNRPIRSFVRREGRMTEAQRRAFDEFGPRYLLDFQEAPCDLDAVFGRTAPRTLEIGFGMGDSVLDMARRHPERDHLGVEVHRPGVGRLLRALADEDIRNVRILCADAVQVLTHMISDATLDAVFLFFPDPWHKTRHHKRRIVQPAFVELIARRLKPGGIFHLATDWEDYARHMLAVLEQSPSFTNSAGAGNYAPRPDERVLTKFERRGERLGHGVWDLVFSRTKDRANGDGG